MKCVFFPEFPCPVRLYIQTDPPLFNRLEEILSHCEFAFLRIFCSVCALIDVYAEKWDEKLGQQIT